MTNTIEVKRNNGLTISAGDRGRGASLQVHFPQFMSHDWVLEQKNILRDLAVYTANLLQFQLLTSAAQIVEEMKGLGFAPPTEGDAVYLEYQEGKAALFRPFIFNGEMDIDSYVNFNHVDAFALTLTPGSFSDMIITTNIMDQLFAYTKDFLEIHYPIASIYLIRWVELLEKFHQNGSLPEDLDAYKSSSYMLLNPQVTEAVKQIRSYVDKETEANKNDSLDTLTVDGKSVVDYMKQYDIRFRVGLRHPYVVQIALALKTPVQDVMDYIQNYLDKARVL